MQRSAQISALVVIAQVAQQAQAGGIKDTGLWTGNDYYDDDQQMGVKNGVPYSKNSDIERWLEAAWTIDGVVDDYLSTPHINRIKKIFPKTSWESQFTKIDSKFFTYETFLQSVAEFPAFCNETNVNEELDVACKRELATFFAHVTQETGARQGAEDTWWRQGLHHRAELTHHDYKCSEWNNDKKWPSFPPVQYYGRGPLQISWNYNYGQFSQTFYSNELGYDSKHFLLENPDQLTKDAFAAMSAAMWFYMTPAAPKPSMHDVTTRFWQPNETDTAANIDSSFGTTINIINGAQECDKTDSRAASRGKYYNKWLVYFGLPEEKDGLGCETQKKFLKGGDGDKLQYFAGNWDKNVNNQCKLVPWPTQYSVLSRDDYKRCVCDSYGNGEADCR